ncbi:hypothetical protein ES706_00214 [subsurface metagenome]|nr:ABC transporter permease subunit [Hadesarchaea archaeon]
MALPSSLRQAGTVAKYELWKHLKDWRLIGLIMLVTVFSVLAVKGMEGAGSAVAFSKEFFFMPAYFLITVAGVVFGGDVLASEFERKTGYLLFSNPMRRVTLVAGKFTASFISVLLMISIFFLTGILFMLNTYGEVPTTLLGSLGLAILYGCAVLSLTLFFSSIMGGTGATMLSFFTFFLIMPFFHAFLLNQVGVEPWYLLTYNSGTIGAFIDPSGTYYAHPDFTVSVLVMSAYLIGALILCTIATKRREMR